MKIYTVFIVQAYQTSQYVLPHGGIFVAKWRSSFAGSPDGKMDVQSACVLNTRYIGFYGSRRFTADWTSSWRLEPGQNPISLITVLMLSSYLCMPRHPKWCFVVEVCQLHLCTVFTCSTCVLNILHISFYSFPHPEQ
jgi:hypothetical protein